MEDIKDERPAYEEPQLLDLEEVDGGDICATGGGVVNRAEAAE